METLDNGALLRSHRRGVMPRAADNFRFFADWLGQLGPGDLEISGHREQVSWDPSGVTAVITPWNAPLMLATWRIAPALAAGQHGGGQAAGVGAADRQPAGRHHPRRPGCRTACSTWCTGLGREAGAPLAAHPDVARVSFTGSVATGRQVAAAAGAQLTPVSLELGGKSPLLVFADADLDLAVATAVGQYDNAGQVCLAGTRLLVEEQVAAEFTARLPRAGRRAAPGRPAGRGHRHRAEHHPRAPGAGGRVRPPRGRGRGAPAARRDGSTPISAGCTTSRRCWPARRRARRS